MGEGYYKLRANVGSGRGQLETKVRHLLGVLEKICRHNIVVRVQKYTFVGNVSQRFGAIQKRFERDLPWRIYRGRAVISDFL
jgi:hypothetical protein